MALAFALSPHFAITPITFLLCIIVLSLLVFRQIFNKKRLPPGPRGKPIIGNALDIPTHNNFLTFSRWRQIYGDIIGLKVLGQHIIVLNSREAIDVLLNQRGAIYSGRPSMPMIMAPKWGNMSWGMIGLPGGSQLHDMRRVMNHSLSHASCQELFPSIRYVAMEFAKRLIDSPSKFILHADVLSAASLARVTYGLRVTSEEDPHIVLAKTFQKEMQSLPPLGTHVVDFFPFLTYMEPVEWVFGRTLTRRIKLLNQLSYRMEREPYEKSRSLLNHDNALIPSIISICTDKYKSTSVMAAATNSIAAGAETVSSTLQTFLMAMMLNPDCQRRAQRDIDMLLGNQRLPDIADQESLPYLQAMYLEVLRWIPSVPMGIVHKASDDGVYDGITIPKGSLILPNTWECLHDSSNYPDPDVFRPERFMNAAGNGLANDIIDPRDFAFGYGRRICPGRYLADTIIWITMAITLSLFDITIPTGPDGIPIQPDPSPDCRFAVNTVQPFQCEITPRSKVAIELMNSALSEGPI